MPNNDFLKHFIDTTIENLEHARSEEGIKEYSFEIDCADLQKVNGSNIKQSDKFKDIFDTLNGLKGPALYWFEIISNTDTKKIIKTFSTYQSRTSSKATPALNSTIDYKSKILYVGKVKKLFLHRLRQHLGFCECKRTQGLQLYYWTNKLSLKLRVNIYVFDNNMADIMPIVEYAFAKRLNPLIGKHK